MESWRKTVSKTTLLTILVYLIVIGDTRAIQDKGKHIKQRWQTCDWLQFKRVWKDDLSFFMASIGQEMKLPRKTNPNTVLLTILVTLMTIGATTDFTNENEKVYDKDDSHVIVFISKRVWNNALLAPSIKCKPRNGILTQTWFKDSIFDNIAVFC